MLRGFVPRGGRGQSTTVPLRGSWRSMLIPLPAVMSMVSRARSSASRSGPSTGSAASSCLITLDWTRTIWKLWVVLMVRKAARFGRRQVDEAREQLRTGTGRAPTVTGSAAAGSMRDEKLSHSFQIVLVQSKVVKQELAGLPTEGVDREALDRALETIDITAGNGMSMLREEPLGGTVVD